MNEVITFPGPGGQFFSDGSSLFSSDTSGFSRWDPIAGVQTGHQPDFQPSYYHRGAREFVQLNDGVLLRGVISN